MPGDERAPLVEREGVCPEPQRSVRHEPQRSDDENAAATTALQTSIVPKWGIFTSFQTLRHDRAELMAVRDIIVSGDAWTVYKLVNELDRHKYSCEALKQLIRDCRGYSRLRSEMSPQDESKLNDAALAPAFINEHIRPSVITLAGVNQMLEQLGHVTEKKKALEISVILSILTGIYATLNWYVTEIWDVDGRLGLAANISMQ